MSTTQRYKLTIAYRGTRYHGWQVQVPNPNFGGVMPPPGQGLPTIEKVLHDVLREVLGHPLVVCGSSRTDAGVHAKGQVAHIDTPVPVPTEGLRRACNSRLPDDIVLRRVEAVPETFDAIRSTVRKRYQYAVWNADDRPPFWGDLVFHRWQKLDLAAMRHAAARLQGEHDFKSFAKPGHKRVTTVRTVYSCTVARRGPLAIIGVEGSGFLWNMVRIIAGTLIDVGQAKYPPDAIDAMLAARDRKAAGNTAPAQGLYLHWIKYAETPPVAFPSAE